MKLSPHYDDAALIAHLDGVDEGAEANHVDRHLSVCPTCMERYEHVRGRSARLTALLAEDAGTEPGRRHVSRVEPANRLGRTRIAAAIALLAVAVTLSPVGATIRDWVANVVATGSVPTGDTVEPGVTSYGFDVPDDELLVSVESAATALRLVVRRGSVERGSVSVAGGAGTEEVTLSPGRIGLSAQGQRLADFLISVPTDVSVTVHVNGVARSAEWVPGPADTQEWIIELGG